MVTAQSVLANIEAPQCCSGSS